MFGGVGNEGGRRCGEMRVLREDSLQKNNARWVANSGHEDVMKSRLQTNIHLLDSSCGGDTCFCERSGKATSCGDYKNLLFFYFKAAVHTFFRLKIT